jgi:hypothetical protein
MNFRNLFKRKRKMINPFVHIPWLGDEVMLKAQAAVVDRRKPVITYRIDLTSRALLLMGYIDKDREISNERVFAFINTTFRLSNLSTEDYIIKRRKLHIDFGALCGIEFEILEDGSLGSISTKLEDVDDLGGAFIKLYYEGDLIKVTEDVGYIPA